MLLIEENESNKTKNINVLCWKLSIQRFSFLHSFVCFFVCVCVLPQQREKTLLTFHIYFDFFNWRGAMRIEIFDR